MLEEDLKMNSSASGMIDIRTFTTLSDGLNSCYPLSIYLTPLFFTETLQFHSRFKRTVMNFLLGRKKKLDFSILFLSVALCNINAIHFPLSLAKYFL